MSSWFRSEQAVSRVDPRKSGHYQGRRIIKRDTKIDGGVSIGGYPREAIVVDSEKYPAIQILYQRAKINAKSDGLITQRSAIRAVYETVDDVFIRRSEESLDNFRESRGIVDDKKVALDAFIAAGVGVCRHMALTAGVLLEKLIEEGYLRGRASVNRNSYNHSAHEWARFEESVGGIYIIDVAQKYQGTLQGAILLNKWPYAKPDEF